MRVESSKWYQSTQIVRTLFRGEGGVSRKHASIDPSHVKPRAEGGGESENRAHYLNGPQRGSLTLCALCSFLTTTKTLFQFFR